MKYKAKDTFELKSIAGDNLLIPRGKDALDFGSVIVFNETGVFLWGLMDNFVTADELSDKLSAKYSVPADNAHRDVTAFIKKMTENGLIDIEE